MLGGFSLLLLAAEKAATHSVARSPEVLDLDKLNKWLSGSVYGILGLNLLALALFLTALLQPQLKALQADLAKRWAARQALAKEKAEIKKKELELKLAHKQAAQKEAEANAAAAKAAAEAAKAGAPAPLQTSAANSAPPLPEISAAAVAGVTPGPPAAVDPAIAQAATLPPPPAPKQDDAPRPLAEAIKSQVAEAQTKAAEIASAINLDDVNRDLASLLEEDSGQSTPTVTTTDDAAVAAATAAAATAAAQEKVQDITEAIDVSAINNDLASLIDNELKTEPTPPPPTPEQKATTASSPFEEKTEILAKEERPDYKQPENPSLPEPPVSAQTTSGEKSVKTAAAFEKSLEDLLNTPTDQTEEVPLFNADALEESLKKLTDEDTKA